MKTASYRRLLRGQEYLAACEDKGGYCRRIADVNGWLVTSEPLDVFISDANVQEMQAKAVSHEAVQP